MTKKTVTNPDGTVYDVLIAEDGYQCINSSNTIWGKTIVLGKEDDGSDFREETDEWIAEYEKSILPPEPEPEPEPAV